MKKKIRLIYRALYKNFGPQGWWPAKTGFEVMLGAILTQNTSWVNVEKAIANLRRERLLAPRKLGGLSHGRMAALIRPAGYYNIKARRLKNFLDFLSRSYRGNINSMRAKNTQALRTELLGVNGVGQETADSILLYALDKPVFVVDAYTKRIFSRHRFIGPDAHYRQVQELFMRNLEKDAGLFNEYHALLVRLGKEFCRKNNPRCALCPLRRKSFYGKTHPKKEQEKCAN